MERATTPAPPEPSAPAAPSTPSANVNATPNSTMRIQRKTPVPSTPGGHRHISSVPRTPGTSTLACSSSPTAFNRVLVHTAKCSECDLRNKGTMLRCPGCTFQICKSCQDRRERAGRSFAHGNMLSPQVATPGTSGSVVRRKPAAVVESLEKGTDKTKKEKDTSNEGIAAERKEETKEAKGMKRVRKPVPKPKSKSKPKVRSGTDDYVDNSSDEDFAPDTVSPTFNKRHCAETISRTDGSFDLPSPFLKPSERDNNFTKYSLGGPTLPEKPLRDMSTDELLAYHGVNTPSNPYTAHLLSRDEPVVSNPVIEIPEVVKRRFKPRPTAEEIQKSIQDKVREKMGLPRLER
ncbi:hypothetical protein SVAN01_09189 [Stagonosporopsis vannaccii]|nr:hypothetical protein SVAN01_09189 [Stagonosporopsis vannaccii]